MKRSLKSLLGRIVFESRLSAILLRNAAVIVAFHRIHDSAGSDGLSISVGMFERYCRFFMRHFRVISLRDLVHRLERGRELSRDLAITFDDGYRDLYAFAFPVLQKYNIPATIYLIARCMETGVLEQHT